MAVIGHVGVQCRVGGCSSYPDSPDHLPGFLFGQCRLQRTCTGQHNVYLVTRCTTASFHTERNTELTPGKVQIGELIRECRSRREGASHLGRAHTGERMANTLCPFPVSCDWVNQLASGPNFYSS